MIVSDERLHHPLGAPGALGAYGDIISDAQAVQRLVSDPSALIQQVLIESAWTPAIRLNYPLRLGPSGQPPSAVMRLLKPKVTLTLAPPFKPYTFAPAGEPGGSKWPLLEAGAVIVGLLAVKGAWDLVRDRMKKAR